MEYIDIIYKLFLLLGLVCGGVVAFVKWLLQQRKQDEDISELQIKEKNDIASLKKQHNEDMHAVNDELTLLTYGVLACLKGLKEQGCNGPVTEAINKIEKHLNKNAHK